MMESLSQAVKEEPTDTEMSDSHLSSPSASSHSEDPLSLCDLMDVKDHSEDAASLCDTTGVKEDVSVKDEPIEVGDLLNGTTTFIPNQKSGSGGNRETMKKSEKTRQPITVAMKKEIIKKYEEGATITQLCRLYYRNKSTIGTIIKDKDKFKAATAPQGITKLVKTRNSVTDKMENLLMVWIRERQRAGDSISEAFLCEKARKIYDELRTEACGTSASAVGDFVASKGWCFRFRNRMGLHSVVQHGEAASSDVSTAKDYLEMFENIIEEGGYVPQQVFNCDETGLFWKKLPKHTYITQEEASLPGHKPMKDRLTLMLCANASGDCKIKPLLVYHSENPRAFKHISKSELGVLWRSNTKARVTRILFTQWMKEVFCPSVRDYLKEQNLPMKALLVMDNAPAHPPEVMEILPLAHRFVQVHFLPPNTTPLLQPMDQQVISNFKKIYTKELFRKCFEKTSDGEMTLKEFWKKHFNIADAVVLIVKAWKEVTHRCLRASWRKLWPDAAPQRDIEGFEDQEPDTVHEIVTLGNSMGLEVDAMDLEDLVQDHSKELSIQELQDLHQEEAQEVQRVIGSDEDVEEQEKLDQQKLKTLFASWNAVKEIVTNHHPDFAKTQDAMNYFDDRVMAFFWEMQKSRLKQATMDKFSSKIIRKASQDNPEDEPPAKKCRLKAEEEAEKGDQDDQIDPDEPPVSSTTKSGGHS